MDDVRGRRPCSACRRRRCSAVPAPARSRASGSPATCSGSARTRLPRGSRLVGEGLVERERGPRLRRSSSTIAARRVQASEAGQRVSNSRRPDERFPATAGRSRRYPATRPPPSRSFSHGRENPSAVKPSADPTAGFAASQPLYTGVPPGYRGESLGTDALLAVRREAPPCLPARSGRYYPPPTRPPSHLAQLRRHPPALPACTVSRVCSSFAVQSERKYGTRCGTRSAAGSGWVLTQTQTRCGGAGGGGAHGRPPTRSSRGTTSAVSPTGGS
jgi:hypothetical protein